MIKDSAMLAVEREKFPIIALCFGALILLSQSACSASKPHAHSTIIEAAAGKPPIDREHIEWCYKNRKNYRLVDNSYEGDDGKRYPCISQR